MSLLRFVCLRELIWDTSLTASSMYIIGILSYITAVRINSFTTFLPFAGITSRQQLLNLIFKAELIFLQK